MTLGPSRIEPSAEAQICRSDTSEPSGKPPGPSPIETIYTSRRARRQACVEPSAEAPRASRRASCRARLESNHPPKCRSAEATRASHRASRQARVESKRYTQAVGHAAGHASNHPPKRRERAVGQDAGPISIRTIRRSAVSQPSGKTPGPSRSEPSAEAIHKRVVRQAAGPVSKHAQPREPPRTPRRPLSDPSSKPLPRSCVRSGAQAAASGRSRYRTEPLRLFAVNPLTVGELGRIVMGGVIPV